LIVFHQDNGVGFGNGVNGEKWTSSVQNSTFINWKQVTEFSRPASTVPNSAQNSSENSAQNSAQNAKFYHFKLVFSDGAALRTVGHFCVPRVFRFNPLQCLRP